MGTPRIAAIIVLAVLGTALPAPASAGNPRAALRPTPARDSLAGYSRAGDSRAALRPAAATDPRTAVRPAPAADPWAPVTPRPPGGEVTVPPAPKAASLRVTEQVSPDPVIIGAEAVYTLTVTNTGGQDADDVIVTGQFDRALTPGPLPAACSATGRTVVCGGPGVTVAAGRDLTYRIPVTTSPSLPDGTDLTSRAHVTASGANGGEAELVTRARARTDVEIVKQAPGAANLGDAIAYRLTVINHGPSQAVDVTVQDPTDGNRTTIVERPSECPGGGLTLTCPLGTLAPEGRRTFMFTVTPDVAGVIENCATVRTGSREEDTADNRSCAGTTVAAVSSSPSPSPGPAAGAKARRHPKRDRREAEQEAGQQHRRAEPRPRPAAAAPAGLPPPARQGAQSLPVTGASFWMLGLGVAVLLAVGLLVGYFSRRPGRAR